MGISEGCVAISLSCVGIFNNCCKFTAERASEKIWKIGQYFDEIMSDKRLAAYVFFGPRLSASRFRYRPCKYASRHRSNKH